MLPCIKFGRELTLTRRAQPTLPLPTKRRQIVSQLLFLCDPDATWKEAKRAFGRWFLWHKLNQGKPAKVAAIELGLPHRTGLYKLLRSHDLPTKRRDLMKIREWDYTNSCEFDEREQLRAENEELRRMLGNFSSGIEDQLTDEFREAKREGRSK